MSSEQKQLSAIERAVLKKDQRYKFRKSVLDTMLTNKHLPGKELFEYIMFDGDTDERKQGWMFESLCQILIIFVIVK